MKFTDVISNALMNLRCRKKSTVTSFSLLLLSILVVIVSQIAYNTVYSFTDLFYNGYQGRSVMVQCMGEGDAFKNELENLFEDTRLVDNIATYYNDEILDATGVHKEWKNVTFTTYNEVVGGTKPDKYQIYIPKYLNAENMDMMGINEKIDYEDGEKYVGEKVTFSMDITDYDTLRSVDKYEVEVTIAGVYDNFEMGQYMYTVMASEELMKELAQNKYVCENKDSEYYEEFLSLEELNQYIIIAKDYRDVSSVREILDEEYGESGTVLLQLSDTVAMIENIVKAVRIAGVLMLIVAILNMALSQSKSIAQRKKEFALLKAIGYKEKQINNVIKTELFIIAFVSTAICVAVHYFVCTVINSKISGMDLIYSKIECELDIVQWIVVVGSVFVATLFSSRFGIKKVEQIKVSDELKSL